VYLSILFISSVASEQHMIPEKLKQTDQCLIELLRDRLSLLTASKIPAEEQLAQVRPLLASAGIPESI
jgi:hypothetical protein